MTGTQPTEPFELAILGAGPVGLEAAARAREAGWATVVIERAEVADHVRRWGSVRLFSPFSLNAGPHGRRALREAGVELPDEDAILTGHEFRQRYLLPLADATRDVIEYRPATRVVEVARAAWLKADALGSEARSASPFRILVERAGQEEELFARRVFDCTGTYGSPNWAGPGGAPARGERALRATIEYHLPDLDLDRGRFSSGRTLLLGGGHSAATAAVWLAGLAADGDARFAWGTLGAGDVPLARVPDDPLPERDDLLRRANRVALDPPDGSEWWPDTRLRSIEKADAALLVQLEAGGASRTERFDRVLALVGYEPDDSLYRQLQIHECYASRAPMKLAAALLAASGDGPADCLADGGFDAEVLGNPEPDFFILGMKSYGKGSAFLMRTGYEQVEDAFALSSEPRPTG